MKLKNGLVKLMVVSLMINLGVVSNSNQANAGFKDGAMVCGAIGGVAAACTFVTALSLTVSGLIAGGATYAAGQNQGNEYMTMVGRDLMIASGGLLGGTCVAACVACVGVACAAVGHPKGDRSDAEANEVKQVTIAGAADSAAPPVSTVLEKAPGQSGLGSRTGSSTALATLGGGAASEAQAAGAH